MPLNKKTQCIYDLLPITDVNLVNIITEYSEKRRCWKRYFSDIILKDIPHKAWYGIDMGCPKKVNSYVTGCIECDPVRVFMSSGQETDCVMSIRKNELNRTYECHQCCKD